MRELNGEQIKRALECCLTTSAGDCISCGYRRKKSKLFATCTNCLMADALALINSYEQKIKELAEENERLRLILPHIYVGDAVTPEQMEELRMAHKLPGMHGDPVGEKGECGMKHKCVAETVQKMHFEIKERCIKGGIYPAFVARTIDTVTKEMLEGKDELH